MHTPAATTPFSAHEARAHNGGDVGTDAVTPAMIAAGSRVTRELVRFLVGSAFVVLEAVFRLDDLRFSKRLRRQRRL